MAVSQPTPHAPSPSRADDLAQFYGPNAGYVLELYDRYLADPNAVDPETRAAFASFAPAPLVARSVATNGTAPSAPAAATTAPTAAAPATDVSKIVGAVELAVSLREYGHLAARLDPLGSEPPGAPELDPAHHGLAEADLAALPASAVGGPGAEDAADAGEAIERLRAVYCGTTGYDFDHVQVAEERAWLRDAVECARYRADLSPDQRRHLLKRLTEVEGFERFLHQTYLGQKRFSIEGTDVLVPMLDEIVHSAAAGGTREIVVGMAHRGRLNVMTHVLGKPYNAILAAFEGVKARPGATAPLDAADDRTGDVKYHLGARLARDGVTGDLVELPLVLAPNPSHLEFVNPVVVGMARASQDQRDHPGPPTQDAKASLGILLHGDAAFPGQGIVAETLNLSGLPGYTTAGTLHIIVNNQIGFTTDTTDSRSTLYASDLAKGFEIPIVHVNADDPEACLSAARLAFAYRDTFGKDFLIDLIGYRRWGHNEGDEPAFTQPRMYDAITKHPTVRALWAAKLAEDGVVPSEEAAQMEQAVLDRLAGIRRSLAEQPPVEEDEAPRQGERHEVHTAVPEETLRRLHAAIHALPEGFVPSPKLKRQWDRRRAVLDTPDGKVDWAHAEALAFAAILADGVPIRLTGQDAARGTFSHRHLVLHDAHTGAEYVPLHALPEAKAALAVHNSPLSENAAMGFEYGYSVHAPGVLVLWEAQFGDFANGAQVIIDQFLVSARAKWRQRPALVLLLPHGYEGQGPEHSSARLERFLQLSARDNIRVCNVTTAGQYFHLLRRQARRLGVDPRPMVLMTPKSLLRHPLAASPLEELAEGTFRPVLDDPTAADRRESVTRLVLCSGKVVVDLEGSDARSTEAVAIARVEQLQPFQNTALRAAIANYPNLAELVWLQEEPRNMGAWGFMEPRLRELTEGALPIRYAGRPERASPAEGSATQHAEEQARIVGEAFADPPSRAKRSGRTTTNGAKAATNGSHAAVPKATKARAKAGVASP
ncbi:MAG: 2-oxoglutarate dehydrogenase E1 component [uncultured Thermomicrobiales bacterium]|uniref:oxoglutarate dehydrogenase (succinyl-transferring) n=1 Tax=uncultured Thermomicrobiales bacterium TaxID=1645740 RepID=A0A6J4TGI4_9BACT|nr:MAG: 2-oxoglutarate dehydrogenase E1 component [uncultured Thermomicrobiales bacterium]